MARRKAPPGGFSSVGRAPDCDFGGRGFEARNSPYMTTSTSQIRFEALYREMRELQNQGKLPTKITREQAIDWAYGNIALHNPDVTRETVAAAYDARQRSSCLHLVPPHEARACSACGVALRGRELSEARTRRAIQAKTPNCQDASVASQPVATRSALPLRRRSRNGALLLASLAFLTGSCVVVGPGQKA